MLGSLALKQMENEENKVVALQKAIQEGIDSGIADDFDPLKNLDQLKEKRRKNGRV